MTLNRSNTSRHLFLQKAHAPVCARNPRNHFHINDVNYNKAHLARTLPFPSAGSHLQEQKTSRMKSRADHTSRACPLTQFTHPPKATTQLSNASNRTKQTSQEHKDQRATFLFPSCSAIGHAANRPNQPQLSEPKVAPNFAIFRQGCCSADPATRFSGFWGAGADLLIRG